MFIPINRWTAALKKGGKCCFSYETKSSIHLPQLRECVFGAQSWTEKLLLCDVFIPIDRQTLIIKNGGKWCFSYESKASMSFIPMSRIRFWYPIVKRKQIIMWIRIYPNWQMNFNSKNGGKISFSYETKTSISFILLRRISLSILNMKRKKIIMWIHVYPN